jgi:hypothetical protein
MVDVGLNSNQYEAVEKLTSFNPLTPELNPSAQRCLPRFFLLGILNFKGLNARRLYKSFGVKGLILSNQNVSFFHVLT